MNSSPRLGGMYMKLFEKVWQVAKVEVQSGEPNLDSLISAVLVEILCALNKISHETSVVNSSDLVKDLENVVPSLFTGTKRGIIDPLVSKRADFLCEHFKNVQNPISVSTLKFWGWLGFFKNSRNTIG